MKLASIVGNEPIKHFLKNMVQKRAIGNSLLFAGPDGVGKSLFAEAFAELLFGLDDPLGTNARKLQTGNHPDLHVYRPEGKVGMHSIATLREFNEQVYMPPSEAKWKVFIVHDAERMLTYSANALLKTFEEPALDSVIILLSSQPEALLPTIMSRCRMVRFQCLSEVDLAHLLQSKLNKSPEEAQQLASLAKGSAGNAFRIARQEGNDLKEKLIKFLAKGKLRSYHELTDEVSQLVQVVEVMKSQSENEVRESLFKGVKEDLSAAQQQFLEKEVDGAISRQQSELAHALFTDILAWYRDMQLLAINGNDALLMHRDHKEDLVQAREKGLIPIETVQKYILDAQTSLERSTSLNLCLENLFLKLNFL